MTRAARWGASVALALALIIAAPAPAAAQIKDAQQKIFSNKDFPTDRPPLWDFRRLTDARKVGGRQAAAGYDLPHGSRQRAARSAAGTVARPTLLTRQQRSASRTLLARLYDVLHHFA